MNRLLLGLASLLFVFAISCENKNSSTDFTTPLEPSHEKNIPLENNDIPLISIADDQGQVVPGTRALVGSQFSADNPWIQANELGQISIPKTWTNAQDLTIDAPGHVRLTLQQQTPVALNITLKKKSQLPSLSVKGVANGITTKDKDGFLDFSIVLDSLTKKDVLNFNINKVISPWTEEISAIGFKFPIPQNIFLPKQKETYFLTVTLQKPWFSLGYDSFGAKSIYSLRGKFPLKKMLSELQNRKPYYELINHFDFSTAGRLDYGFLTTNLSPAIDTAQIPLDRTYSVKAPVVDGSQVVLGISSFKEKNFYQPLDVKYMQSNETLIFKSSQTATPFFIGVMKNKDEFSGNEANAERMSVSIDAPKTNVNYLPLTKDPSWVSGTTLEVDLPSMVDSGFSEQGMVVVISELQNITLPDGSILKYKLPQWEIHSANWHSLVDLPEIDTSSKTAKRVEVTLLATELDNSGQQNPVTLISNHEQRVETATHLTKSARDY